MVVFILRSWSLEWINSLYAIGRMLIQLLIIAYFLTFLFSTNNSLITLFILVSMVFIASWIALGTVSKDRIKLLKTVFIYFLISFCLCCCSSSLCVCISRIPSWVITCWSIFDRIITLTSTNRKIIWGEVVTITA